MRWHIHVLFFLLAAPLLLAGCTTPPAEVADDDDPTEPGQGFVRIYVKRPLQIERHPIWTLEAVPRFVAFLSGDDDTESRLGPGYTHVAKGWSETWAAENHSADEHPPEAERDWMQPQSVWFEGAVPAGNFSTVRIEIMKTMSTHTDGGDIDVQVFGGRLSVAPAEGKNFRVIEGETRTLVFESLIEANNEYSYIIK